MTPRGARDLFRLRWLGPARISPDAARVGYLETTLDEVADRARARVGVVTAATGRTRWLDVPPDPLDVAWSPDGRSLAVCAAAGLWVVSADGGGGRRLAAGRVTEAAWSPDGRILAFTSEAGPVSRILAISAAGGRPRALGHPGAAGHPRWSPDGRSLAFLAAGQLWRTDAGLRAAARVAVQAEAVTAFAWSPDSAALACLGRRDRDLVDVGQRLWVVDAACGTGRELPGCGEAFLGSPVRGDDPRGTGTPEMCWSAYSGRIYLEASLRGRGPLAWLAPGSGQTGLLLDGPHACLSPTASLAGQLAVVISGPAGPGDVWLAGEDGGSPARLTAAGDAVAAVMAPVRHLAVERDGVSIDAWLTGAPPKLPAPLLVSVHGGPYYAVGWRFTFEVQRLAAHGAFVLTMNPRGSSGCGDDFAAGNRGDWGGADAADVSAVVGAVAARPDVDAASIALWGVSYGGFMTQWLLTRPGRYRAGISENGICDFRAIWAADPSRQPFWRLAMGGTPAGTGRFGARSPLRSAGRISAPLLLVHAEQDENCPVSQSRAMLAALRGRGADAELVTLPGEGHLVNLTGRPSSRLLRARAVDRWLARTLFEGAERPG